jgi:hypothetical protein
MIIQMNIPEYEGKGLELEWDDGAKLTAELDNANNSISVGGISAGLISLACHLLTLAQLTVPSGYHVHLDESNSLQNGPCELNIGKL